MGEAQRFWAKVIPDGAGCLVWATSKEDYPRFRNAKGELEKGHRVSWRLKHGPIPKGDGYHGTEVCHSCDNRRCVNPDHLFISDQTGNMQDMENKGRGIHPSKELHGRAKLTEKQVEDIRSDGRFQRIIAAEYGVNQTLISAIKRGKIWTI